MRFEKLPVKILFFAKSQVFVFAGGFSRTMPTSWRGGSIPLLRNGSG